MSINEKKKALPPEKVRLAYDRVRQYRDSGGKPVACPLCEEMALKIIDQSARPYVEWYHLTCEACGLEATLNIPLGRPSSAN